jgi:hypothetical protein
MRTVVAGRSRGTILFSAQQFKSTVDPALHENTGMHIIAKLGMSELSTPPYLTIDESTKANIVRLNKGELVMVHPAFRQPIKIVFQKPHSRPARDPQELVRILANKGYYLFHYYLVHAPPCLYVK